MTPPIKYGKILAQMDLLDGYLTLQIINSFVNILK